MPPVATGAAPGPRRGFIKTVTGILGGLLGAVMALPGLALLLHPARRETVKGGKAPLRVAALREVKAGRPLKVDVRGELVDAWNRIPNVKLGSCWLVKSEQDGKLRAFSTVCPHLGCGIDWNESDRRFVCPCHDSYFSLEGKTLTGPAPRDMDELPLEIEGQTVKVAYRRFRVGTPSKEEVS
jgi:Rieske Fe-S protein